MPSIELGFRVIAASSLGRAISTHTVRTRDLSKLLFNPEGQLALRLKQHSLILVN